MEGLYVDAAPFFGKKRAFDLLLLYNDNFLNNPNEPFVDYRSRFSGFDIWIEDDWLGQESFYSSSAGHGFAQTLLKALDGPIQARYNSVP
jgi:hypothetical protein